MFGCLLCSFGAAFIMSIDFGSQYLKIAESTFSGIPQMVKVDTLVSIPTAITLKKPINMTNIPDKFDEIPVKFRNKALYTLKKHPELGYEFLLRVVGRNETEFHTSQYLQPMEAFATYITDLVFTINKGVAYTVVIPSYWAPPQREFVQTAFKIYNLPVEAIIDDATALASLYGATRYTRYQKKSHNVMFVDVGATSLKVIGLTFQWQGESSIANETVNEFSEKVGGYYFAKAISESRNISMKKAYKILKFSDPESYKEEIKNITSTMRKVLVDCADKLRVRTNNTQYPKNSFDIDEVQLIGGASAPRFIAELVRNATGAKDVRKDFNAAEAIATGGVYFTQAARGTTADPPTKLSRLTPLSIDVRCGNVTARACQKGANCKETVYISSRGCDRIDVTAPAWILPEGSPTTLNSYELVNMTDFYVGRYDLGIGYVMIDPPDRVKGVSWCRNQTCAPIAAKWESAVNPAVSGAMPFLRAFSNTSNAVRVHDHYLQKTQELMRAFPPDIFDQMTGEIAWYVRPIKAAFDLEQLPSWSGEELKNAYLTMRRFLDFLIEQQAQVNEELQRLHAKGTENFKEGPDLTSDL